MTAANENLFLTKKLKYYSSSNQVTQVTQEAHTLLRTSSFIYAFCRGHWFLN